MINLHIDTLDLIVLLIFVLLCLIILLIKPFKRRKTKKNETTSFLVSYLYRNTKNEFINARAVLEVYNSSLSGEPYKVYQALENNVIAIIKEKATPETEYANDTLIIINIVNLDKELQC